MQSNDTNAAAPSAAVTARNQFFASYINARSKVYPADASAAASSTRPKRDTTSAAAAATETDAQITASLASFTVFEKVVVPVDGGKGDGKGGKGGKAGKEGGKGSKPSAGTLDHPLGKGHAGENTTKPSKGGGGSSGGSSGGAQTDPEPEPEPYVNIVKTNAEKYFLENVLYFTDDDVLEMFEQTKPTLNAKRLSIVNDANEQKWYKDYSNLLFTMKVANGDDGTSRRILKDKVEADLQAMCDSQIYAHQTMLLQTYAFIERYPKMEDYLDQAAKCATLYVNYWSDETHLASIISSFQSDKANDGLDPSVAVYNRITDIKIVLDILDPTSVQSTKLINRITHTAMASYYEHNMTNNQGSTDIINLVIKDLLTKLDKDTKNQFYELMKHLTTGFGSFPGLITEMQEATRAVMYTVSNESPKLAETAAAYAERLGSSMVAKFKTKLAPNYINTNVKVFFCSVFRVCQAAAVTFGFLNKDHLKDGEKPELIGETTGLLVDMVTMFKSGNKLVTSVFARTAAFVGSRLAPLAPATVAQIVPKCLAVVFTANAAKFMLSRFTPVLLLVASYNLVEDVIEDFKKGQVGALLVDLTALGVNLAAAVALFWGTSWSGPFALVASGVVVVLALIKFIFYSASPQEQFFSSYVNSKYKKAMPIIGGMGG
ncbi:hypothetical protein SAMD00019534_025350 [Acytostelium subglobosum LB1]|uniref:hypothetical protein n=1 Tax=Acytostelium subglobosum LB1 TaxID=1410327 RepID=UPI000644D577|nr:hypothetical protein SAMD00019534_025350 [Acytostelium subglobosum LB1]GAM19360.1 hypothetical protein SAMD00019534_025350 [Acytostelium subglobosum LB1]|eukprot:XP_012757287.1 hypothetical protein SAMD00019534_025350 [Acytostelium subglobosum LB1]